MPCNCPTTLLGWNRRSFDEVPACCRRRVFGVDYVYVDLEEEGEIYFTRFGWAVAHALLPKHWYHDDQFATRGSRLDVGTGAVYRVASSHPRLGGIELVVKFSRFAQDVPLSVAAEFINDIPADVIEDAHFNSPFEEFGILKALRLSKAGPPGLQIRTKHALAIYIPRRRFPLWQSGRTHPLFDRGNDRHERDQLRYPPHERVGLDIESDYILLFGWVTGQDAQDMYERGLLTEQEMIDLTHRVVRELADKGYRMLDIKPRHFVLRTHGQGKYLIHRRGELSYVLIDFELLLPIDGSLPG